MSYGSPGPTNSGVAPVRIYNPLPRAGGHFAKRLTEVLELGGISSVRLASPDGEVGGGLRAKAFALGTHLRNARRHVQSGATNVVVWPLLGWWEIPLWRHQMHKTLVVVHDPEPLVRQNGLSPRAATYSAKLARLRWPEIVTMSPEAYAVAAKHFDSDRIHLVPHPMQVPGLRNAAPMGATVLVLGQYKPARDLDVMVRIAPALRASGWNPIVAGRGWPQIPGWRLIDEFMSEGDFQSLIGSAAVVILPYRYYFQSGVALRALEAGVPVVGRDSGFLNSVLGANFPGAVEDWDQPDSWLAAIEAATSARVDQMRAAAAYSDRGIADWRNLVQPHQRLAR